MNKKFKDVIIRALTAATVVTLTVTAFTGCKKDDKKDKDTATDAPSSMENASISYYDYDLSFLKLGKYKGVEITKDLSVTEKEILDSYYDDLKSISNLNTKDESGKVVEAEVYKSFQALLDKTRPVKDGDFISLDYAGYLDGEAFSGGTAKDQELRIGSGSFIPGFEESIIGHTPGNEFDINVTFPEEYQAEDLAGKAVVFKITVHYIYPEMSEESIAVLAEAYKQAFEKEQAESSKKEEYKPSFTDKASYVTYATSVLKATKENEFEKSKTNKVFSAVIDDSEFSGYPENLMKEFDRLIESNSAQYGIEKDVYLMYFYGVTTDEQYESLKKYQVGVECVTAAVIQAEKITVSDEEVNTLAQNYVKEYGFESLDALYKAIPKTTIENMLLSDKASELMTKNAVVKVIDEAATDK